MPTTQLEKDILLLIDHYLHHKLVKFKHDIELCRGKSYNVQIQDKFKIEFSNIILEMDLDNLKQDPVKFITKKTQKQLEMLIQRLNDAYYNGASVISDELYDIIINHMETNYKSDLLDKIGADVTKEKVQLPTFLPSMEKIKPDTNALHNWKLDYPGEKVTSDKLDGMSLLVDVRCPIKKAYTRGNGSVGQDISWLIDYINIGTLDSGMVRGELLVSKINWDKLKKEYPKYSNGRNFVSGYTGRKNVSNSVMKYIDFIAYEYITDEPLPLGDQLNVLKKHGLSVVNYSIQPDIDNKTLSNKLLGRRSLGEYDVDGIIITDNKSHQRVTTKYPKYAKAFKMILDDQVAEVVVLGIHWEPSMHGLLNPVVKVSPVNLDGATISNASGYNAKFIINNDIGGVIGPGSIVTLNRSGGVIPKVLSVVKKYDGAKEDVLPKQLEYFGGYTWTDTGVDIILNQPDKIQAVQKKRLVHFFGTLGVPYFKEGLIGKVFDEGYNTIYKIIEMQQSDLLLIDGVKERSANKILDAISSHYNKASLLDIMAACHIFGSGFGRRKLEPIVKSIPDILEYNLLDKSHREIVYNKVISLDGFQDKTVTKFLDGLEEFQNFHSTLPTRNNVPPEQVLDFIPVTGDKYIGKVFSSTGFRPNQDLKTTIETNGGKYKDNITNDVTDLIVKSKDSTITCKIKKATDSGINIVYLDEFNS